MFGPFALLPLNVQPVSVTWPPTFRPPPLPLVVLLAVRTQFVMDSVDELPSSPPPPKEALLPLSVQPVKVNVAPFRAPVVLLSKPPPYAALLPVKVQPVKVAVAAKLSKPPPLMPALLPDSVQLVRVAVLPAPLTMAPPPP